MTVLLIYLNTGIWSEKQNKTENNREDFLIIKVACVSESPLDI